MEQNTNRLYTTLDMKSRLFSTDPLFWRMLSVARSHYKATKSSGEAMTPIYIALRGTRIEMFRSAYLSGYNRMQHENKLAGAVTHDMHELLDENNYHSGNTLLLWQLIYDEPYFHIAAKNVIERHAASLE